MTDARFPERWLTDRRIMRLDAESFRVFMVALAWCASNRTDGAVSRDDLPMIPHADGTRVAVLVRAGLWHVTRDGWQIDGWDLTQTTRAQLEHLDRKRVMDRERKARQRARERDSTRDVTRDGPGDNTGQDRPGQDRHLRGAEPATDLAEILDPDDYLNGRTGGRAVNDPT